jgi:hypothetical protein
MHFDLDLSIDVLRRTPVTLQVLLGDLAEPWIRGTERPDTFSPFDGVAPSRRYPSDSTGAQAAPRLCDGRGA